MLNQIVTGQIKNIKIDDANDKAGGVLSKSVPRPKPEDTSEYMRSLNREETDLLQMFQAIRDDKNEDLLKKLVD